MAYTCRIWTFKYSIEYEFTFAGNYGAKGEKREKRKKKTLEQIKKQNAINRAKYVRRLIKANFDVGDYWITLKYAKGTRKPVEEVQKDVGNFISKLRKRYKKQGDELKYIYRVEIGRQGGLHIHIILNRARGKLATDLLVTRCWTFGHPNFQTLYEEGGYDQLACYLIKQPEEEYEDMYLKAYHPSRNLARPEPEVKGYRNRTVRKLVTEGPVPHPGYYIDEDTVVKGINPYTGLSYMYYTEVRIKPKKRGDGG